MSRRPQLLLEEVLAEEASPAGAKPGLEAILAAVRRRHRMHQAGRVVALVAVLMLAMSPLVAPWFRRPARPVEGGSEPTLALVVSVPLDRDHLVETQSGLFAAVSTLADAVTLFATAGMVEPVPEIDDQQLLLLAADHTPALVRRGPHAAVLLLLDEGGIATTP